MTVNERDLKCVSEICSQIEAQAENYSSALVQLVLVLKEDEYSLHSGVITFLEIDDKTEDEQRDYGMLVLMQKRLEPTSICRVLNDMIENQMLTIAGLPHFEAKGNFPGNLRFIPSGSRTGYLKSEWPAKYIEYSLGERPSLPHEPLFSLKFPIYPDGNKAVIDYLNLRSSSSPNSILIHIPDYRVRITDLNISGKKISFNIEPNNISADELVAMFYAEYESHTFPKEFEAMFSPNLHFRDNLVEYEFEHEYKYILAAVLNGKTGEILDHRRYSFDWPSQEGITIERDEIEISEMIRRGENLSVEFKQEIDQEFLETVVAFSNTNGGFIFLGIADDSSITGFLVKTDDQITNLITSNVEPVPVFNIGTYDVDGKPITVVAVLEGDDKPYSHRQKGVYVRSGATDRRATRTDLDRIYREKSSSQPKFV